MAIREINLIPSEILSRRYRARHLVLWAVCLAFSMALVIGFYFQQSGKRVALMSTETDLQEAGATLSARINSIKQLQAVLENLTQEQSIMDVVRQRQSYSQILLKLSLLLNNNTWFRHISAAPGSNPNAPLALQITGLSYTNDDLGEFMSQLSFDPAFDSVVLKYSRGGEAGSSGDEGDKSVPVIQFLVECNVPVP